MYNTCKCQIRPTISYMYFSSANLYSCYCIAGNFQGRRLSRISRFTATRKSFLHKILGLPHPFSDQFNILRKFSPRNAPFLPILARFRPQKLPTIKYAHSTMLVRCVGFLPTCAACIHSINLGTSVIRG